MNRSDFRKFRTRLSSKFNLTPVQDIFYFCLVLIQKYYHYQYCGSMMDEINNIQLYQMFWDCKWNQFSKEPDFDKVLQLVSSKLKVKPSEKLAADIRRCS